MQQFMLLCVIKNVYCNIVFKLLNCPRVHNLLYFISAAESTGILLLFYALFILRHKVCTFLRINLFHTRGRFTLTGSWLQQFNINSLTLFIYLLYALFIKERYQAIFMRKQNLCGMCRIYTLLIRIKFNSCIWCSSFF